MREYERRITTMLLIVQLYTSTLVYTLRESNKKGNAGDRWSAHETHFFRVCQKDTVDTLKYTSKCIKNAMGYRLQWRQNAWKIAP